MANLLILEAGPPFGPGGTAQTRGPQAHTFCLQGRNRKCTLSKNPEKSHRNRLQTGYLPKVAFLGSLPGKGPASRMHGFDFVSLLLCYFERIHVQARSDPPR